MDSERGCVSLIVMLATSATRQTGLWLFLVTFICTVVTSVFTGTPPSFAITSRV